MKQELKTVYIPTDNEYSEDYTEKILCGNQGGYIANLKEQELITFTPEEYNQHLKNILSFLDLHTDEAPISYIKREFIKQFPKYEYMNKNLHLLPTNKPSKLTKNNLGKFIKLNDLQHQEVNENQNIYITNDEKIKKGDWVLFSDRNLLYKVEYTSQCFDYNNDEDCKKIILTTDQSLDGVQAIDDNFLEWFVKNPSCQEIPIIKVLYLETPTYRTNIGFEKWRTGTIPKFQKKNLNKKHLKKLLRDLEVRILAQCKEGTILKY